MLEKKKGRHFLKTERGTMIKNKYFHALLIFARNLLLSISLCLACYILINGMYLTGVPDAGKVERVTITYSATSEEYLEITEKEDIEFAVNLTHFLNYSIFQKAGQEEQPLITITYHLTDGNAVSVSANREMVWWKGKVHVLRKEDLFVNLTENIFFSDE